MDEGENKVLVIGGTGFIGSEIVARLIDRKFKVYSTYVNCRSTQKRNEKANYIKLNLNSQSDIKNLFSKHKFDYIFNAAGYVDHSDFSNSGPKIIATHFGSLLDQFKYIDKNKLKKYVYLGSADEYPDIGNHPQNEALREKPKHPYSFAKVASTHFLQMLFENEGWPTLTCRVFLTFGDNQNDQRMLAKILSLAKAQKNIPTTHGNQVRDFCDIVSLTDAILDLGFSQHTNGQVINVGSGVPRKVKDVVSQICELFNVSAQYGEVDLKKHEPLYQYADIKKMKTYISGFQTVEIEDYIKKCAKKISDN